MGKNIKKFETLTEYKNYYNSDEFIYPNIALYFQDNEKILKYRKLEYQKINYISSTSTGGQYIDLGCHLMENTDDIRIDIKFNIKNRGLNSSAQQGTLICSQPEVSPYPGFVLRYQNANANKTLQLQTKWNFTGSYFNSGKGLSKYLTYNNNNSLDNNIYEFSEILDNIPSSQINDCTCTLFCALDSSNNPFRYVEADLYYLKFTKGEQVIRNLIPVKKIATNEVGLYDLENDHFYISQGNEPFIEGI